MAISNSYVKLPEGKFDHDLTDLAYDFFEPSSGIILERESSSKASFQVFFLVQAVGPPFTIAFSWCK